MTNINEYGPVNVLKCQNDARANKAYTKAINSQLYKSQDDVDGFNNYHTCPPFYYEEKEIGTECRLPGLNPQGSFIIDGETVTICAGIVKDATTGGYYPGYMDEF